METGIPFRSRNLPIWTTGFGRFSFDFPYIRNPSSSSASKKKFVQS